ncbi:unnamed protein product [Parnassius apollo]|uniref:(apollo) hypothetical protein n=1 Tax=Parnassius apollo TaxID=110799 RepID=A0A8S3W381_PARAO|nr:unnamed protein product [Parnassius apollo]
MDMGRVCIDHQRIHLENFSPFLQCHKCLQFGHMKTRCTSQESFCSHCASNEHQISDCPVKNNPNTAKCHNCHSHNTQFNAKADIKHPANSDSCPRLHAMRDRIANRVDYGSA